MTDILDEPIFEPRADKPKFLTHTYFDEMTLPEPVLKGLSEAGFIQCTPCLLYTSPSPRDRTRSRMPSSA